MQVIRRIQLVLLTDRNYPLATTYVTEEQGGLAQINDELLKQAKKHNPELDLDGLLQAVIREGLAHVAKQVKYGRLSEFLKNRRR